DYFWLREKSDPAVAEYLEAENAYAKSILAPTEPLQEELYQEMLGRIQQTDLSVPMLDNGWYYYSRTEEGKQYPIHARKQGSLAAPEQSTLDLNELAKGQEFMALGAYEVSDDGNLLAFSTDSTGFRQYTLQVKDLRTGRLLPERREKVVSVAWAADGRTIFYTVEDPAKRSHRVYRLVLGESGSQGDELVYEEDDERFGVYVWRTKSRRFVNMYSGSLTTSEVRVLEAAPPAGEWRLVLPRRQDIEYDVDHHGDRLYLRINDTGRNFRLVSTPVENTSPSAWTEVLPHREDVMLTGTEFFRDHWIALERANSLPRMTIPNFRTSEAHSLAFPEPVYSTVATGHAARATHTLLFRHQS